MCFYSKKDVLYKTKTDDTKLQPTNSAWNKKAMSGEIIKTANVLYLVQTMTATTCLNDKSAIQLNKKVLFVLPNCS